MGYGYGYCCCDDTTQCIQQPIYPWIGLHTGIKPGMSPLVMRSTVRGPGPSFAPLPPWDDFPSNILLFGDGFSYTRPGPQLDGFNVSVEASGDQMPFPLYPYEILRTVRNVSITRGAEVLALRWDEASDRLVIDEDLTTATDHCIQADWLTVFAPKIWTTELRRDALNANVPLLNWHVDGSLAGWGNSAACNALNGIDIFHAGQAGGTAYTSPTIIDGYVVFVGSQSGPLRINNGLGGTVQRIEGVGFNRKVFNTAIGLSSSSTVRWGYHPANPLFAGSPFIDPYPNGIIIGSCTFPGSPAMPTLAYVYKSASVVSPAVQSAEASFILPGTHDRQAQDELSAADFPTTIDCRQFVNPPNPCTTLGNLSSLSEAYL